ncbi:hypothetical protein Dimus_023919 [Dionaea muscipula]
MGGAERRSIKSEKLDLKIGSSYPRSGDRPPGFRADKRWQIRTDGGGDAGQEGRRASSGADRAPDLRMRDRRQSTMEWRLTRSRSKQLDGSMDSEASRTARESLELAFHMSNMLDTGLDRQTLSVLIALCDLGLNPESLATVVKELRNDHPPSSLTSSSPSSLLQQSSSSSIP